MAQYIFKMWYEQEGKTYNARIIAESLREANHKLNEALEGTPYPTKAGLSSFYEVGAEPHTTFLKPKENK